MKQAVKTGIVALVGRPNVGKSTLLNNLLKQKVSITSPKPQTTRFAIQAVYEDGRGQIVFIDTPGMYGKTPTVLAKHINQNAQDSLARDIDVLVYLVDRTRPRDFEENQILGLVRKSPAPKILVFNKSDLKQEYNAEYAFYEDEFDQIIEISALNRWNFNLLLNAIFKLLPAGKPLVDKTALVQPGLNLDSKLFLSEIIREKVFLFMHDEIPYSITTQVDEIINRDNGTLFISGRIITSDEKYKKMLIGRDGYMIKKIGMAVRKEIEQAANKEVFVELTVDIDKRWMENL